MSKLKRSASDILSKKRVLVYTLCDNPGGSVISAVFSLNLCKITIAGSCGYTLFSRQGLENYPPEIATIMIYFSYQMNLTVIYKAVHDGNGKITVDDARAALRISVKPDPVKYSNKY